MTTPDNNPNNPRSALEIKRAEIAAVLRQHLHPIVPPSPSLRVFEAGCHTGEAAIPLVTTLQDRITTPDGKVSYEGADIDTDGIEMAQMYHQRRAAGLPLQFRLADLTRREEFGEGQNIDVFVMRHPNLTVPGTPSEVFFRIMGNGIDALKPGGAFFFSVQYPQEKGQLDRFLERYSPTRSLEYSFNGRNPNPRRDLLGDTFVVAGNKAKQP